MNELKSIKLSRVVATLFIVLCHIIRFYTFIPGSAQLGQLLNVGVPIFIFISGYLYGMKSNSGRYIENLGVRRFLFRRFLRVALPCQVWALILFFVTCFSYPVNTIITLLNLQGLRWIFLNSELIEGGPYLSHTWFVTVILLCYLGVPILNKSRRTLTIHSLLWIYLASIFLMFTGINISYFALFILSYMAGLNSFIENRIPEWMLFLIALCSIGLRLIGHYYIDGTILYNRVISCVTHHGLAVSIVMLISKMSMRYTWLANICDSKVLSFIDRHSYAIYIVHYCVIDYLYLKFNLLVATVCFALFTILMAVILDVISNCLKKSISKQ